MYACKVQSSASYLEIRIDFAAVSVQHGQVQRAKVCIETATHKETYERGINTYHNQLQSNKTCLECHVHRRSPKFPYVYLCKSKLVTRFRTE